MTWSTAAMTFWLEKGMTNPKSLEDAAFDRIRGEEGFKEISGKLAAANSK